MSSNHIFARALRMAKQVAVAETPPASKTRRRSAQPKVDPLVFVSLGSETAGVPSNALKAEPMLRGIRHVTGGENLNVIFKLPGFDGWIKAKAKVVWLNGSGTAAGLQFADFPGESRRLVDNWLSMREQNGSAATVPGSSVAAKNILLPAAHEFEVDSYQVALPVEAIEVIPGPQSFRPVLMQAAVQSSSQSNAPRIETNFEKSAAAPQPQGSASLPAAVQSDSSRGGFKNQLRSSQPFSLALAALIGMFVVAGLIFWHAQGELSRPLSARSAQPEVAVEAAALPELPAEASQNSSEALPSVSTTAPVLANGAPSATNTQSQSKPEKAKPETPKDLAPSAPNQFVKTMGHVDASRPAPAQQMPRKAPPSAPTLSAANSRSTPAVSAPAPAAAPGAPAGSISERPSPSEPTVPAAPAEKASAPAAAPMVNTEIATGSVEVISDPYPSIRAPADAGSRASGPVALTIGHLIFKVEPLYPPEALSQRISGTVKLHVVRGLDGSVESASVTEGPAPLREAALRAVQQWRYEPTLLGSTAVKADEDVSVVYRIATPSHQAK